MNGGIDIKAVIMAGGEGTRLRPLSSNLPKPMVRMFDRPVIEHIVNLLKRHGITDIMTTLQYMPKMISDYFGDGSAFGVSMSYSVESTPMGTAGSVKQCGDFIKDDDFIVISGDAVCDLDLKSCIDFHRSREADATIVLYTSSKPLEYGLVMTDKDCRIERFIEKPSWGQVFTDTVNTGIYVLSPSVMKLVPDNTKFDFACDLFPMLLGSGADIYGVTAEGFWCDMGDIPSYLRCCQAALSGEVKLSIPAAEKSPGVWSGSEICDGATIIAPCYIGENVTVGHGSIVGPYACLGSGSRIAEGAAVVRSVLDGAQVGPGANVNGAVLCRGSVVKGGVCMSDSSALGEQSIVGEMATIAAGVKIWPEKTIAPGIRLERNIASSELCRSWVFDDYGVISGEPNFDLTPEFCMHIGMAVADWAGGEIAVSRSGEAAARTCMMALEIGISSAGKSVVRCDATFPSAAAYAARGCRVSASIFVEQKSGSVAIRIFNREGLPPSRESARKIEHAVLRCEFSRADPRLMGTTRTISGVMGSYSAAAASGQALASATVSQDRRLRFSAPGTSPSNEALRAALAQVGCRLHSGAGLPVMQVSDDGFSLTAIDESGQSLSFDTLIAIITLLEFDSGMRTVAVPYGAPKIIDDIAESYDGHIMRVGRDGVEASRLFAISPQMHDGIFAAARIAGAMVKTGATLRELRQAIPSFSTVTRDISLDGDRGLVMRLLADQTREEKRELYEGLRISTKNGWVHITPHLSKSSLRITGEGSDTEIAEELCSMIEKRALGIDKKLNLLD